MAEDKGFFRDAGPVILRLEHQASWSRIDASQFRALALVLACLALGLALVTWGRVHVLTNGYEIMDLQAQRAGLLAQHRRLEDRIAAMQSLAYAEQAARSRLGMVDINPNQVITLHRKSKTEDFEESVEALFSRRRPKGQGAQP